MKLIKRIKKTIRKSPTKVIERAIKKNPKIEHLFMKPIGKAVKEVTNFKLKSQYSSTADFKKILQYKFKKDNRGNIQIHNHIEHLAKNMAAIPSEQDIFTLALLSKEFNTTSGRIFVTDPKGITMGQTAYKIGNLDPNFKNILDSVIEVTYLSAKTGAHIIKNKKENLEIQKKRNEIIYWNA